MRAWIGQPPETMLCGQVAVAVVHGISLLEAIHLFGHDRGTRTREMVRIFRSLGYTCPDRLVRMKQPPVLGLGALRRSSGRGNWHWVVYDGPYVWDGAHGNMNGTVEWPEGLRVTSYLPLT